MAVAPLLAGWQKWAGGLPGPQFSAEPPRALFPVVALGLRVEIQLAGVWTDITHYVYSRDAVVISRGKSSEANVADPSTVDLTLNNRDGRFSPRNPTGPYYGRIGRNTPLRIWVDERLRFHGAVSSWPTKWDTSGSDVWVPVQVAGILRRLSQGATPLNSVLYRSTVAKTGLVAYWPAEDGENSSQIASAVPAARAMRIISTAQPDFAAYSAFEASSPIPNLNLSSWLGTVPSYTSTGQFQVRFLLSLPAAGATSATLASITCGGTITRWDVVYTNASGGQLRLDAYQGNTLFSSTSSIPNCNGLPTRVAVNVQTDALGNLFWEIAIYQPSFALFNYIDDESGGVAAQSVTTIKSVTINPSGTFDDTALGQIAVTNVATFSTGSSLDIVSELQAHEGETAAARILRLCTEEGVPVQIVGTVANSSAMGPQLSKTLLELLTECATADAGILYEPRDTFGLTYRTRESLYNRPTTVQLNYSTNQLTSLEPVDDDQLVRNDITVSRVGGSSSRQTLASGALSVQDPPNGVGRYDESVSLNLYADSQLDDQAGWRLHLGTVDEARYPVINLNLASPELAGNADLLSSILNLDIGDLLTVVNPPAWLPPEAISQGALGYTETLNTFQRTISVNCVPASPYRVGVYEDVPDTDSRYSPDTSALAADIDATATSLSVSSTGVLWGHNDGDFDIMVGGERMTVTNVTGASSPQTFTVTRSVNGVVKSQTANTSVELFTPVYYAL